MLHTVALDTRDRVERVAALGAGNAGLDVTYGYNRVSQVLQITDPRPGASQFFSYDALDRVKTAMGPWGILSWNYDPAGNRTSESSGAGTTIYTYQSTTQRLTGLSGAASESFSYDPVGRLSTDSRGTYTYNARGQLATVTSPSVAANYHYGADGRRLVRQVNDVTTYTTHSAGGQVLSEFQAACAATVWTRDTIYAGGRILGAVRANLTPPTISMVTANASVPESQSTAAIEVRLTTATGNPTTCPVTVSYAAMAGTVTAADATVPSGTIAFAAGTASGTTQSITVPILADTLDEEDETLVVHLSTVEGGTLAGTTATTLTILDDDDPPSVSVSDGSAVEGDSGTAPLALTVSLSAPSGKAVTVHFAFADVTATASADYATPSGSYTGSLVFPPGITSQTITADILADLIDEPAELFDVTLTSATNATIADGVGRGTIVDNDPTEIRIANTTVKAGQVARFTVTLSTPAEQTLTVNYGTADDTAVVGVDYHAQSGVLTFDAGATSRTLDVSTILDAPERDETFLVSLYGPSAGAVVASGLGTGTVVHRRKGDLNGDGKPDLLWQHETDGSLVAWFMDGLTRTSWAHTDPVYPPAGWRVVGTADFTGDGYQDMLLQHGASLAIWQMRDVERTAVVSIGASLSGDANWHVRAVGDFNGDGHADIAFHHATQDYIALWLLQGTTLLDSVLTSTGQVDADVWHIVGAGDVNADGRDDLFWQEQGHGYLAAWLLNGGTVLDAPSLTPYQLDVLEWKIRGAGDYNLDGKPDLLWHHQTSDWLAIWLMNGTTRTDSLNFSPNAVEAHLWRLVGPR